MQIETIVLTIALWALYFGIFVIFMICLAEFLSGNVNGAIPVTLILIAVISGRV